MEFNLTEDTLLDCLPIPFKHMFSLKDFTPLDAASLTGHLEIVEYLITECGCNPNPCDTTGLTPVCSTLMGAHFEISRYLLTQCECRSAGSSKSLQLQCGEWGLAALFPEFTKRPEWIGYPLQFAIFHGDLETVKVLCNT